MNLNCYRDTDYICPRYHVQCHLISWCDLVRTGLSSRAGGQGFSPATKRVAPWLLLLENRRKIEPKEIPSRLIPRLLVVFTRQLEILVTTLLEVPF